MRVVCIICDKTYLDDSINPFLLIRWHYVTSHDDSIILLSPEEQRQISDNFYIIVPD